MSETLVYDSMLALANTLEPLFPDHCNSIRRECLKYTLNDAGEWTSSPQVMTETRWNRLADVICSLAALPGVALNDETKRIRFRALCLAEAPRAMARHCFGGKRSYGALDTAVYIAEAYAPPAAA